MSRVMETMTDRELRPMLARLARAVPVDGYLYEPKWDGFRCLAFRDRNVVDLRSRNQRPLARYFPELIEALLALPEPHFVLDGEVLATKEGRFDFEALLARLHPAATRVRRLGRETPASLVAFDLVEVNGKQLRDRPFVKRRSLLERLIAHGAPPLFLTPLSDDHELACRWLQEWDGPGIDGVVAKHRELRYGPGRRWMIKVKRERTAECVVAGFRWFADRPMLSSLLLGLYDDGILRHVGLASSFSVQRRSELLEVVRPYVTTLAGHPWEQGFLLTGGSLGRLRGAAGRWSADEMELDWSPLAPELVCEVAFDQVDDHRFRHPARFRRWRSDRDPRSCTVEQIELPPLDLDEVLSGS
jgi:ATP-dependent DNA ligase